MDPGAQRFEEKRKFKRLKGKEGGFVAFMRHDEFINTGQILDISMGGVSIRYLSTDLDNNECFQIKIFTSGDHFIHLDKVPCRIVYDQEVAGSPWQQISTKRCGVEFKVLSIKHLVMLQDFIDHFAFDETQSCNPQD